MSRTFNAGKDSFDPAAVRSVRGGVASELPGREFVDLRDLLGRQPEGGRGQEAVNLLRAPESHNRAGHGRLSQRPGEVPYREPILRRSSTRSRLRESFGSW